MRRSTAPMPPEPAFSTDLYRGTGPFYDRYRPPYPQALIHDLCARLPATGSGRLLDMACGTGQIARPLASRFAEVVAVDQEPEAVAVGQAKARAAEITNIVWRTGSAETVDLDGTFELVTIGNAFHRLDRPVVAGRLRAWLQAGGGVALLWSSTPANGHEPWQRALAALIERWIARLGTADRMPAGWLETMERRPHRQILEEAGFDYVGKFDLEVAQTWTVESLTGFMYSTSILNQAAVGDQQEAFERDLAVVLRRVEPSGVFTETASFAYELARAPSR